MDTAMMLLLMMQLFCLVLVLRQVFVGANITCLDKEANDTLISLNCTVDNLDYGIVFTYPNNRRGQAYCVVPILEDTLCDCSCNSTPACNCSITQDIATNITSLQIWGTNLTEMFGWYTCAHGSYKKSIMVTRHVLWLDTNVNDEMIKLSCTPDEFTSRIDFYFPKNIGHAYCKAPRPSTRNFNCSCNVLSASKCNIFQDIATKTTTLEIYYKNLTSMFGRYICAHGFDSRSTMVTITSIYRQDNDDCQLNTEVATIIVPTMSLTAVIVISIFIWLFPDIPGRTKEYIFGVQVEKAVNLSKKSDTCALCNEFSIYGFCVDCEKYYCDICCKFHLKENQKHQVGQIQYNTNSKLKIVCKSCCLFTKLVERLCKNCKELFCVTCAHSHRLQYAEHVMLRICQAPLDSRLDKTGIIPERLNLIHTFPLIDDDNPVRILGIAYLPGDTIVAIDANNCKMITFNSTKGMQKVKLDYEPCAMTGMTGNKIAVTFPNEKLIRIYIIDITQNIDNIMEICKDIDMRKFDLDNCTPFSIAYNGGFLAVEVGKSNDGMIIVFDIDNIDSKIRIKVKSANFTGEQIRIALIIDKNYISKSRLFISAIGKKSVICMDLAKNELWQTSIPSPRSIIVSEDFPWDKTIMLSCRRGNAIYGLTNTDDKNGDEWILLKVADNIRSPRYMAYQSDGRKLCVLVENENSHYDELAVFEITDAEPSELTSLNV